MPAHAHEYLPGLHDAFVAQCADCNSLRARVDEFWQDMKREIDETGGKRFKHLSEFMQGILTIPHSSVHCERIFSCQKEPHRHKGQHQTGHLAVSPRSENEAWEIKWPCHGVHHRTTQRTQILLQGESTKIPETLTLWSSLVCSMIDPPWQAFLGVGPDLLQFIQFDSVNWEEERVAYSTLWQLKCNMGWLKFISEWLLKISLGLLKTGGFE